MQVVRHRRQYEQPPPLTAASVDGAPGKSSATNATAALVVKRQLLLVQMVRNIGFCNVLQVMRHGDRAQAVSYFGDPNEAQTAWPQGYAQLSDVG